MTTSPEEKTFSDDTKLTELTVGEFKQLIQSLIQNTTTPVPAIKNPEVDDMSSDVADSKKMSLDELMNDLEG